MAVLWVLAGAWCAEMEPSPSPDAQLLQLSDGLVREIEGTVTDAAPERYASENVSTEPGGPDETTQRVDVLLDSAEYVDDTKDTQLPDNAGVRLTVLGPGTGVGRLRCGDRIRAAVRLLPPHDYRDPGAWSRTEYLLEHGITATASVPEVRLQRIGRSSNSAIRCFFTEAQHSVTESLMAWPAVQSRWPALVRLTQEDAAMLSAMVSGDRTFLTRATRVGFERTGSFHMLVVAGFHLAIVAGCVLWVARRLRMPRVPATLLTIALSAAYAFFTGFATPVQRSLLMVSLYLIGRLVYRDRSALNTIGFAALCMLAASPRAPFESSFQMTLLAVIAIGGIAAPLLRASVHPYIVALHNLRRIAIDGKLSAEMAQFRVTVRMFSTRLQQAKLSRIGWHILPATIRLLLSGAEALVVTLVIELAMVLPMAIYFHRVTLFALPVNLCVLPLLLVLLPFSLLTILLLIVWPPAAIVPGSMTAVLLHLGTGMVRFFGKLRFADMRIPAPHAWQMGAFCILMVMALFLAHRERSRLRAATWLVLLAGALVAIAPNPVQHPADAMLFQAFDVGQGDSLLLITPEGKTMLVDAGGASGGLRARSAAREFDIGEEVVSAALWDRGIRSLDVVALSHAHSDHMGGIPAILRNFHPHELWVGDNPHTAAYDAVLKDARDGGTRIREFRAGDSIDLASLHIDVLAPVSGYHPASEPANNDSLVLRAQYRNTSVLLEGDAEAPVEHAMLGSTHLQSSLLKVGHHGSVTSTQPEFLARVAPQWAVISCGLNNPYGHPRPEILEELEHARVRTFSTDVNGSVCFRLNGASVAPEPCNQR